MLNRYFDKKNYQSADAYQVVTGNRVFDRSTTPCATRLYSTYIYTVYT